MRNRRMYLLVIQVERHGVADEILSTSLQSELLIDHLHAIPVKVDAYLLC